MTRQLGGDKNLTATNNMVEAMITVERYSRKWRVEGELKTRSSVSCAVARYFVTRDTVFELQSALTQTSDLIATAVTKAVFMLAFRVWSRMMEERLLRGNFLMKITSRGVLKVLKLR